MSGPDVLGILGKHRRGFRWSAGQGYFCTCGERVASLPEDALGCHEAHLAALLAGEGLREDAGGAAARALTADPIRGDLALFPVDAVAGRAAAAALDVVRERIGEAVLDARRPPGHRSHVHPDHRRRECPMSETTDRLAAALHDAIDGDFLVAAGMRAGNEGEDMALSEVTVTEVVWWAARAVADVVAAERAAALRSAIEALDELPGTAATGYYASGDHAGYNEATADVERLLRDRAAAEEAGAGGGVG